MTSRHGLILNLIHGNSDPLGLDKNTEGLGHHWLGCGIWGLFFKATVGTGLLWIHCESLSCGPLILSSPKDIMGTRVLCTHCFPKDCDSLETVPIHILSCRYLIYQSHLIAKNEKQGLPNVIIYIYIPHHVNYNI